MMLKADVDRLSHAGRYMSGLALHTVDDRSKLMELFAPKYWPMTQRR